MRMFFAALVMGALGVLSVAPSAAAEFASSYDVEGVDPGGGGRYSGEVSIRRTSEATFEVVWVIGNDKFTGTGIGSPEGLAIGYKSGSATGVAIFSKEKGGVVTGYWTYAGGKQVGQEKWTPK